MPQVQEQIIQGLGSVDPAIQQYIKDRLFGSSTAQQPQTPSPEQIQEETARQTQTVPETQEQTRNSQPARGDNSGQTALPQQPPNSQQAMYAANMPEYNQRFLADQGIDYTPGQMGWLHQSNRNFRGPGYDNEIAPAGSPWNSSLNTGQDIRQNIQAQRQGSQQTSSSGLGSMTLPGSVQVDTSGGNTGITGQGSNQSVANQETSPPGTGLTNSYYLKPGAKPPQRADQTNAYYLKPGTKPPQNRVRATQNKKPSWSSLYS